MRERETTIEFQNTREVQKLKLYYMQNIFQCVKNMRAAWQAARNKRLDTAPTREQSI